MLSNTLKQEIESEFDNILKNRDMRDAKLVKSLIGITPKYDIQSNLENWSSVFVKV